MADPRFFKVTGPYTLSYLAKLASGQLGKGADADLLIHDVAPLTQAQKGHLSFLDNRKYSEDFQKTRASACIAHPDMAALAPPGVALILSATPYKSYAYVAQAFYPSQPVEGGVAPSASVHPTARLDTGTAVATGAVIHAGAQLGKNCVVESNAVIAVNVEIGDGCIIGAGASVTHALIGHRVKIYPGARIGQDGFGFAIDPQGYVRVPQLGRVIIEDDVEVGANTTIDRGSGPDTVIGRGTMIDNLVQIAHNVRIGPGCVIVAQVGISGSVTLEKGVMLAGQVGVAGHLKIGAGARIAAQSGVIGDIQSGAEVCGMPARDKKQFFRQMATLGRLARPKGGKHGSDDSNKA